MTLKDAVYPDGATVDGSWIVIGRHGDELIAESRGTIIRFPEKIAEVEWAAGPATLSIKTRKRNGAVR